MELPDSSVSIRTEGTTVQLCGDSNVAEKWINGHDAMGQQLQGNIGRVQKTLNSRWKRKIAYPVAQIDHYLKHIFREHNHEADPSGEPGTEGKEMSQSIQQRTQRSGKQYVAIGMGATKPKAGAAGGVVTWTTIGKIAVPLKRHQDDE